MTEERNNTPVGVVLRIAVGVLPLGPLPRAPPLVALSMQGNRQDLEEEVADQDAMVAVAARESPAHPRVALVKAAALLPRLGPAARQRHHRQSARRSWAPWLRGGYYCGR